ncbi:MAG: tetratricopeptide repeat protein, partial [Lachnospiraceae bacterium]|nr:tetratricopeptide repeat protein [Lachnospiraceae bacterium]
PNILAVKVKFADLAFFKGEYEASRDAYMELLRENNYDNNIRAGMLRANLSLIEENKKKIEENPDDNDTKIELAWSYYQSYKFEEAIDILGDFKPKDEKVFEYYNVKGRSYLCLLDYKNALNCFYKWKEAIESLPKDDSEEIEKKRKRLPYVNFLLADCYLKLKDYNKADILLNKALEVPHDEIVLSYEALCELKYETGQYDDCIKACEKLIGYGENNYIAYDYMAKSCFKLNYIKESIDACESAINIYPYAADPYVQEVDIFLELGQLDTAKKIVERYKQFDIPSDQIKLKEAQILMKERQFKDAYIILDTLLDIDIKESDLLSFEEVYSLISFCFENMGKPREALSYLNKLIQVNPNHKSAYGRMGLINKGMNKYDQALECFDNQLKINPHPYFLYEKATVYVKKKEYTNALENYLRAADKEKDNSYIYREIGLLYEHLKEYDKAINAFDKAIAGEHDEKRKAELYIFKGRNLQILNRFDEADELYSSYGEQFGVDYDYVYDYSTLLQRLNKIDEAINLVKNNLKQFEGENIEIILLRHLCSIYGDEGYVNLANETFTIATGKYPKDVEIYRIMGDIFCRNKLFNEAMDCYLNAIGLDFNGSKNYYSNLVECMLEQKNVSKTTVKEYIKKALAKGAAAKNVKDYIMLAKIYRLTKKYKLAISAVDAAFKKDRCYGCFYSACHEALYEKGLIYEAMKKYDQARQCYKIALKIIGHSALYEGSLKRIDGK